MKEKLVSPREAAELMGLRYGQIMRRLRKGKFPGARQVSGWGWAIPKREVMTLKKKEERNEAS